MKRHWGGVTACLLSLLFVFLQPDACAAYGRPTGSALVFGLGGTLTITRFDGASVAYQTYLRENLAWRLTVGLDLSVDDTDLNGEGTGVTPGSYTETLEEWQHTVSVSSEWLTYRGSEVSLYFGGGPHALYQTWRREDADFIFYPDGMREYHIDRSGRSLSLGVVGVLGVQWSPANWCALHAEYRVVAAYVAASTTSVHERVSPPESYTYDECRTTEGFELESRSVSAGLSILF